METVYEPNPGYNDLSINEKVSRNTALGALIETLELDTTNKKIFMAHLYHNKHWQNKNFLRNTESIDTTSANKLLIVFSLYNVHFFLRVFSFQNRHHSPS